MTASTPWDRSLEDWLPSADVAPSTKLVRADDLPPVPPASCPRIGPYLYAGPTEAWVVIPDAGRWRMVSGTSIEVAPESPDHWIRARCMSMASPLAALIHQRGELPLHAATLAPPGGKPAVVLCAESGTGKSTTAVALSLRGWTSLTDDVTHVVALEGRWTALPGWSTAKLWPAACSLLGLDPVGLPQYPGLKEKRLWRPPLRGLEAKEIGSIVVLSRDVVDGTPVLEPLRGLEAVHALGLQTFRPRMVGALGDPRRHATDLMGIAQQANVLRLRVPASWDPLRIAEWFELQLGD